MHSNTRHIPLLAAIRIIIGRAVTRIGWLVFSFLMIFGWTFGSNADLTFLHFFGETTTTEGYVTDVIETNMEINEQSVYANVYEYLDHESELYVRDAFSTGRSLSPKQTVTVEYPLNAPQYGRIAGYRSDEFSGWLVLIWGLPLIGLGMILWGIRQGYHDVSVLKVGIFAKAMLIDKTATSTEINDQTVYELTFEFDAQDNKAYQKVIKTHKTEALEDDLHERLLYDPADPTKSTLVDDLADSTIDADGKIIDVSVFSSIKLIFLPIICIAPHVWYFFA